MPKGSGYGGQGKTGHLMGPGSRTSKTAGGGSDGTEGGQKKTGHLDGPGAGGIKRPSGKDPVGGGQAGTGTGTGTGGGRSKGTNESNPARVDEISEIG